MGANVSSADRHRAIVIGGSMAGLTTARVLSDHFREVILVERDRFGNVGEHRRGVPQDHHAHGLLAGGGAVLESLFPGFYSDLSSAGAVMCNVTRDCIWCLGSGEYLRFESDLKAVGVSRPLLEGIVRERVRKIPNISIHDGCQVKGLATDSNTRRVTGVKTGTNTDTLPADLVVDATGRASRSPLWLEEMGFGRPQEERIEINLSYVTRLFRRSPHHLNGALFASIPPNPRTGRGGVIAAQEGDVWIVTMDAYSGVTLPTDLDGFIEFARTLSAPHIYQVIANAEPLGESHSARFPASIRRRYENMKQFPEGYLVVGDAISSFNPVYAQGMSAAALQVAELRRVLKEGRSRLAHSFFTRAAKVIDTPWSIAAGNDLCMPGVVGRKTPMTRFFNWYVAKLHAGARQDPTLALAFHRVANLLAPPLDLLRPDVIRRVFACALNPGREMPASGTAIEQKA